MTDNTVDDCKLTYKGGGVVSVSATDATDADDGGVVA